MPVKPIKVGMKFYLLADSKTSYIMNIELYTEKYSSIKDIVSDLLSNHTEKNYGLGGTALEYSFTQINNTKNQWNYDDVLLFCETELVRRWFFSNLRQRCTFNNIHRDNTIHDRDKKWIQRWFTDFHNVELSLLQLKAYYYMLIVSLIPVFAK